MGFLEFLPIIGKVLDRVIPDPKARADAQLELAKLADARDARELDAELQTLLAQIEVNKAEATNPNLFVSGWRPFIGWTAGVAFAYDMVMRPFISWISLNTGLQVPPALDSNTLTTLLFGMLGFGGMRMWEKFRGVAK